MSSLSFWVDESEKGPLLAVGGVMVPWHLVPHIVQEWRRIKVGLGLDPGTEVKWNLPQSHATRIALERGGCSTRRLSEEAIRFVSLREDVICIVAVMFDERSQSQWKSRWAKASVRDFYCEGLKYALQRVAEEAAIQRTSSCVIVCDRPELGTKSFSWGSIKRGQTAVDEAYAGWYKSGVGVGPGRQMHNGCLAAISFHPSVLVGDGSYHDMLQLADVVVGATRDWVDSTRRDACDQWVIEQIRILSRSFRSRHGSPDFFGDGLVLWPWQPELWSRLQQSLR